MSQGPYKIAEMGPALSGFPKLAEQIRSGEFIVIWNAALFPKGEESDKYVLGYQRCVAESGGWVLRGRGSVEKMRAEQFKAMAAIPTKPCDGTGTRYSGR